jgi:hypothetical protein
MEPAIGYYEIGGIMVKNVLYNVSLQERIKNSKCFVQEASPGINLINLFTVLILNVCPWKALPALSTVCE